MRNYKLGRDAATREIAKTPKHASIVYLSCMLTINLMFSTCIRSSSETRVTYITAAQARDICAYLDPLFYSCPSGPPALTEATQEISCGIRVRADNAGSTSGLLKLGCIISGTRGQHQHSGRLRILLPVSLKIPRHEESSIKLIALRSRYPTFCLLKRINKYLMSIC